MVYYRGMDIHISQYPQTDFLGLGVKKLSHECQLDMQYMIRGDRGQSLQQMLDWLKDKDWWTQGKNKRAEFLVKKMIRDDFVATCN